jgi:uncharacterized protein (DUF1800 family)
MADLPYNDAAFLLNRLGFGGTRAQIESLVARGREGAVDYLLNYEQIKNTKFEKQLKNWLDITARPREIYVNLRRWWVARMLLSERQFEEKLTLFWHNFFATADTKTFPEYMYFQNLTLRQNGLGRFDQLVTKIAQDPAMLMWLDGFLNVRGEANENFARELQELFTMGTHDVVTGEPNYTEEDVKEIARAFTGWQVDFRGRIKLNKPKKYESFFVDDLHDAAAKTIYGQTANYRGEDVIAIICNRRATPRFLVKKIFEFFVRPLTDSQSDKQIIEKFADVYVANDHQLKPLFRAIFVSDEMFSPQSRTGSVKSPVEFIVNTLRAFAPDSQQTLRLLAQDFVIYTSLFQLGMHLFTPPDVSGWRLHLGWINTSTMLERFNFANRLLANRNQNLFSGPFLTQEQLRAKTGQTAEETVTNFLFALGPLDVDQETHQRLVRHLVTDEQGNTVEFRPNDATINNKVRSLVHQILCLPEYQLN